VEEIFMAAAKALERMDRAVVVDMRSGDISQMLDRLPKVALTDLKPGDALVISGVALGTDNSKLLATNLIAGVEPILQSAPQRQSNMASDWGFGEMSAPQ
jgi:hypothetical protein